MEFSKKLLIVIGIIDILLFIFTCYMVYITQDLTPLTAMLTMLEAVTGVAVGYYYWKAKAENIIKLSKDNEIELEEIKEIIEE